LAGLATVASAGSAIYFLVSRLNAVGSAGWGQFGGFEFAYADWQNSPQAPEIYFGVSFTLVLIFLCASILLSGLPRRAKAVSVAVVILFVLNSFYIWTSNVLYPESGGLQIYVVDSVLVSVSVVTGSWAQFGIKFIDFGLPALALCVGGCGASLGRTGVDRAIGFFSWTSVAVFPLALECHYVGYGHMAVVSYFGLSGTPLQLVTNDLLLYLSGTIMILCLLFLLLRILRPAPGGPPHD